MANRVLLTKSVSRLQEECPDIKSGLKRTLSKFNLTILGIGAITGRGIFLLDILLFLQPLNFNF
jgi:hypothetical protein